MSADVTWVGTLFGVRVDGLGFIACQRLAMGIDRHHGLVTAWNKRDLLAGLSLAPDDDAEELPLAEVYYERTREGEATRYWHHPVDHGSAHLHGGHTSPLVVPTSDTVHLCDIEGDWLCG